MTIPTIPALACLTLACAVSGGCVVEHHPVRTDLCDGATSGEACRWAGTGQQGLNREDPQMDRLDSLLNLPTHVSFGLDGRAYITDWNNHMIRRVEHDQTVAIVVGTDYEGDSDPEHEDQLPRCAPQGITGTDVALNHSTMTTFGPDGSLYIAAWHNNKIRKYDPSTGIEKVVAGDFYGFTGDGGQACNATLNQPSSIAFGTDGTMYIADQRNVRIRKIMTNGEIATIAGDGHYGNQGDGGPAALAEFGWDTSNTPPVAGGLALQGNLLYVADSGNNKIRRIDLQTGIIDSIAGQSSQAGYGGDGGSALLATFNYPLGMAFGPDHRLYVADQKNHAVRAIDLVSEQVETVVGNGTKCDTFSEPCPDRAPAADMELNDPYGVSFDADGNLYVADTDNNRIIKVIR